MGVVGGVIPLNVIASWAAGSVDGTTFTQHSKAAAPLHPAAVVCDFTSEVSINKVGRIRSKYPAAIVAKVFSAGDGRANLLGGRSLYPRTKSTSEDSTCLPSREKSWMCG